MGIEDVGVVKQWWSRLLTKYTKESVSRVSEKKSGNPANAKRPKFTLHELIKDMLSTSQASRETTSNYKPTCSTSHEHMNDVNVSTLTSFSGTPEQRCVKQVDKQNCYDSSKASGRRGRKKIDLSNALSKIDETVNDLSQAMAKREKILCEETEGNLNKDIGDLIFCELQRMGREKAERKRAQFLGLGSVLKITE